jgi:hypothetical protein
MRMNDKCVMLGRERRERERKENEREREREIRSASQAS